MNKKRRHKSDSTSVSTTTIAAAPEYYTSAWYAHIARLNTCSLVLVHILSFVRNDTDAVSLVCKKWHRFCYYATFERDWKLIVFGRKTKESSASELSHVMQFEPRLVSESPYINSIFRRACWVGEAKIVRSLLQFNSLDPKEVESWDALEVASLNHVDTLCVLLASDRVDLHQQSCNLLCTASRANAIGTLKVLLADKRFDPGENNSACLSTAVDFARADAVRVLMADPRVTPRNDSLANATLTSYHEPCLVILGMLLADGRADPTADNHAALCNAIDTCSDDAVRLLMTDGRCDPTFNNYQFVLTAVRKKATSIIRMLLQDRRVDVSRATTLVEAAHSDCAIKLLAYYMAVETL